MYFCIYVLNIYFQMSKDNYFLSKVIFSNSENINYLSFYYQICTTELVNEENCSHYKYITNLEPKAYCCPKGGQL